MGPNFVNTFNLLTLKTRGEEAARFYGYRDGFAVVLSSHAWEEMRVANMNTWAEHIAVGLGTLTNRKRLR